MGEVLSKTLDVEEEDEEQIQAERQRAEQLEYEHGLRMALAESSGKWTQASTDEELKKLLTLEVLKLEAEKKEGAKRYIDLGPKEGGEAAGRTLSPPGTPSTPPQACRSGKRRSECR